MNEGKGKYSREECVTVGRVQFKGGLGERKKLREGRRKAAENGMVFVRKNTPRFQ